MPAGTLHGFILEYSNIISNAGIAVYADKNFKDPFIGTIARLDHSFGLDFLITAAKAGTYTVVITHPDGTFAPIIEYFVPITADHKKWELNFNFK